MKALKYILIFYFIVINCQNTNNRDKNQIVTFNIKERPKTTYVKLSDLQFVDIEYIPLESNEHCMIQTIIDIEVGDDCFLINALGRILKFQTDGSFINNIGTQGRGPNEFTVVHDVETDKKRQKIYIVDGWAKKFYIYSENGEFIRTLQCPYNTINIKIIEEGILCYSINSLGNTENSYNLIDTNGRIIKSFPNRYPYFKGKSNTTIFIHENIFYQFNNRILKKEIYSDTIYVFENMDFKPHIVIDVGERLLTPKARSEFDHTYLSKNYITPWNLFEFGNYIYYEYQYEFIIGGNNLIYGFIGSKENNYQAFINSEQGFINDLDGGPNIWPKTIKDGNTIISWIEALQIKTLVSSEAFKNSNPKYPEKKKELEKLAASLKETDNPVLVLVRLKK